MKIVSAIYNLKQLNKCLEYIDGAILNNKDTSLIYEDLDLDKAILLCKNNNVLPIIAINKMLYPEDLDFIKDFMNKYKDSLFLATDIAVYMLALELNIVNRVIFDPQTMITNQLDLNEYSTLGFDAVSMSLEIPISDLNDSINNQNASVFYQIFGHRLMFYSKRRLVSLYEEKANISASRDHLYLRESTREDYIPTIENNNGTMMYRPYLISLMDNFDIIKNLKYGYLESLYLDDNLFLEVLKIYKQLNVGAVSLDKAKSEINKLGLNIQDGFTYQDSVYQKELF